MPAARPSQTESPFRESSALAEVRLADLLVRLQLRGLALQRDAAGLEDVAAARDVERHQGVLLDKEDRSPLLVDLDDRLEDAVDEDRREPHRRLVEHEQLRPG